MRADSKRSLLTSVFDCTGNERFGAVLCGNMRENSREIRVFTIIYHADTLFLHLGMLARLAIKDTIFNFGHSWEVKGQY